MTALLGTYNGVAAVPIGKTDECRGCIKFKLQRRIFVDGTGRQADWNTDVAPFQCGSAANGVEIRNALHALPTIGADAQSKAPRDTECSAAFAAKNAPPCRITSPPATVNTLVEFALPG